MAKVERFPGRLMDASRNTTVRAATPVLGQGQWFDWAKAAMWLAGNGAQLVSIGPQMTLTTAQGFSCHTHPHRQIRNWLWILSLCRTSTTANHVYGHFTGAQGTSLGEWALDSSVEKHTPQTFYFVESFSSALSESYQFTPVLYIDSTHTQAAMLGLQAVEIPMNNITTFSSTDQAVVDPITCANGASIYEPASGRASASGLSINADTSARLTREARRVFLFNWSHPAGVSVVSSSYGGSTQILSTPPTVIARHLYYAVTTGTVRVSVRAACVGGATTADVRFTASTGDTVTLSISGGTNTWYHGNLLVETEDPSRNATDGGIRGGTRDTIAVEARVTGGTTSVVISAIAITERE